MYDELVKRLRASCESCKLWDGYKCCLKGECSAQTRLQAADTIEELAAFKAQITDGRFYVYKFGTLFELRHDPRDLTVKFQYPSEPPKEETE